MQGLAKIALAGGLCAGLIACEQPDGGAPSAASSATATDPHGGSRRGDDWLGNARSFPYQR